MSPLFANGVSSEGRAVPDWPAMDCPVTSVLGLCWALSRGACLDFLDDLHAISCLRTWPRRNNVVIFHHARRACRSGHLFVDHESVSLLRANSDLCNSSPLRRHNPCPASRRGDTWHYYEGCSSSDVMMAALSIIESRSDEAH